MGPQEQSVHYDDGYRQSGQGSRRGRDTKWTQPDFSSYAQINHLDEVLTAYDWVQNSTLFPAEMMRGVGRYETNMRVIAGIENVGGESYNRLF